ncbi:MAG: hypothetical protein ABI224_04865 [Acetobacteraceae bacterium]
MAFPSFEGVAVNVEEGFRLAMITGALVQISGAVAAWLLVR